MVITAGVLRCADHGRKGSAARPATDPAADDEADCQPEHIVLTDN